MSLKPEPIGPIPQETARVAKAACPQGSTFIKMRDVLGVLFEDAMFAKLFPHDGQPALARLSIGPGDHHAIRAISYPIARQRRRCARASIGSMRMPPGAGGRGV